MSRAGSHEPHVAPATGPVSTADSLQTVAALAAGTGVDATSRDKILDVAEALFARSGFAGIGLREVAQKVGLGKSSLFHHFPTKLALYDEVLLRVLSRVEQHVDHQLADVALGPVERLDRWVDAIIDALAEHPTTARLALRALFEEDDAARTGVDAVPAWDLALVRLVASFEQLLSEGMRVGAFREVSVGHLTQTVIGATVYHFASAAFGEEIIGGPLFSAAEIACRKQEVKRVLRSGVLQTERSTEENP